MVRRELAGVPKVEVVRLSKEKVELFWDTTPRSGPIWQERHGSNFHLFLQ